MRPERASLSPQAPNRIQSLVLGFAGAGISFQGEERNLKNAPNSTSDTMRCILSGSSLLVIS